MTAPAATQQWGGQLGWHCAAFDPVRTAIVHCNNSLASLEISGRLGAILRVSTVKVREALGNSPS